VGGGSTYLEDTTLSARLRPKDTYLRKVDRRGGKTDGREDILEFVDDSNDFRPKAGHCRRSGDGSEYRE
jgi:hypothetical protein